MIIGAARSGTTSLYRQLRRHPDIFMPGIKEPTFFSENGEGKWARGLEWYENLFKGWYGERAVGEASTSYTKAPVYEDAPEKIHEVIPDVRLVYILRDPISQIVSHYRHMVYFYGLTTSLDDAMMHSDFLVKVACYAYQLKNYLRYFPKENTLVVQFEKHIKEPIDGCKEILRFLQVDDAVSLPLEKADNSSRGWRIERWPRVQKRLKGWQRLPVFLRRIVTKPVPRPSMSRTVYDKVISVIGPDLEELKKLVELDYGLWKRVGHSYPI
ncbi:MAG: sulfotransferase [Thermodesulfobacteriota bacterium]|nr:sulfotransferase [Thermodesulfobacteriota bacterium]